MVKEIIMPKAGMAMEEGKIVNWLKKEGEYVKKGEPLLEIETDKVNMEIEALESGTLLKITKEVGDSVPVTGIIAYIGDEGEEVPDNAEKKDRNDDEIELVSKQEETKELSIEPHIEGEKIASTPKAKRIAKEKHIDLADVKPSGSRGQILAKDVESHKGIKASPLARNIAQANEISLSNVAGSGINGKIMSRDVKDKLNAGLQNDRQDEVRPLSAMRKVIADRMSQSHTEIPNVTLHFSADVTRLSALRQFVNEKRENRISFNDFIVKAAAKALEECPWVNAQLVDDGICYKKNINIGVAVALEEGLIVPVVKLADYKTVGEISSEIKSLASKAREGSLMPDEYSGGTFTVSNLGMYSVKLFTPIINQPEVAILGVCAIEDKAVFDEDDNVVKAKVMGLSLTFDHRAMDGAQAAIFGKRIVELLETPELTLL